MRLKSLELVGFKSFVDRTTINFEAGVTGIVGPNGCGKCVHGDTLVQIADGRRLPIGDLVEEALRNADDVSKWDDGDYTYDNPEGICVLSLEQDSMKMTDRPVLAFVRRTSPNKLLKIKTKSGKKITATEYHPFFVYDQGSLRTIRADELKAGTFVATPRSLPVSTIDKDLCLKADPTSSGSIEMHADGTVSITGAPQAVPLQIAAGITPAWGRFLGYIISEGQNSKWSNQVRFTNADEAVLEDFCDASQELFGRKPVVKDYKEGSKDCLIFSSVLCDLLDNTFDIKRGGHSSTKRIPQTIFSASDEVVWAFLGAMIEGDGCIRIDRSENAHKGTAYLEYATASEELARGFASLLLRLGVRSLVREKIKKATGTMGQPKTYYSIYVYGMEALRALDKGLSLVSRKKDILSEAAGLTDDAALIDIIPEVTGRDGLFDDLWKSSPVSISHEHPIRGRVEAYRAGKCTCSRNGLKEAVQYIRTNSNEWNDRLEGSTQKLEKVANSDIYWDKIISVEEVPGEEWVYDLCVADTHNFIANDFIVHNSNIVDAIRWVMGEQSAKHLRGSNMGDVIFNGTQTRPAMGMASVFLTFDNADGRAPAEYADYTEITVGRRLYRSGESEYYINKTPCRLKDIIDLFLGTGVGTKAYAIVEQGMIGHILSAKPEDRRSLIEEAAGISKFKARKEAALRKMESTHSNLARLSDILGELQRQMNSLYRQAKKAERFKTLTDELKDLELKVCAAQYQELKTKIDNLKQNLTAIKESEVAGGSKLSSEEADIESERIKLNQLEIELDKVQEALYAKQNEVQLIEADVNYKTKEVDGLTLQIERWTTETGDLAGKIEAWRLELATANSEKVEADIKAASAGEDFSEIDAELQSLRDKHHELVVSLEDARRKVFDCVEKVSASNSHLEQAKRREIEITGWIAKDQAEIDKIDDQLKELEGKVGLSSGDVTGTKQTRMELDKEVGSAAETLRAQTEELERAETKVTTLKEELGNKRSRLLSLEELNKNYEGYKEGVKSVLKRREETEAFEGVVGTINDIVETQPEYESAVGAVLGEKLQYVVVKSHEVGVEAIDYLKQATTGRSTFVPIALRGELAAAAEGVGEGVIGPLVNYVRYADDYKMIVDYLLNDVVLVQDLTKALNLWNNGNSKCTFVTLDGDVVDPTGIVTGGIGGDSSKQLMAHRREIKELTELVSSLTRELNSEEGMLFKLRERVKGIKSNIEKLENEAHHEELKLVNQQKDLHHLEQEFGYYRAQRDKLTVEVAALADEQMTVKKEKATAEVTHAESSKQKTEFEETVRTYQTKEDELREKLQEMIQKRTELNLQVTTQAEKADSLDREINRLTSAIAEAWVGIAARNADTIDASHVIKTSNFSVKCKQGYLTCLIGAIEKLKDQHTEIKSEYDVLLTALREKEAGLRELRKVHDEQVKNMHECEIVYTQKQEKQNYMCREIFDRYRIDLGNAYIDYLSDSLDLETSAERVTDLKDKVEKIGSVNVDAVNEYEDLKTRYDFLNAQHTDLTASMEDLKKAIQKINKTSKIRFKEAFDSVDERFQKLFPKLFAGGKAQLALTDENNILECGVDIIAQPPGKKLQSITLLSGGEKALTAVALVFSLFLHHPSPFCLLDEVDAPLDDANIDRFNDLIREMTNLSQFILITHNKRTMELADTLYGVTMAERGASRVISLSLRDKKNKIEAA